VTPKELHKTNAGDLMTLQDFTDSVKTGLFTNYDGTGYFCTPDNYSHNDVIDCKKLNPAPHHTHVIWFNK
jgi:hypothetical protein